MQSFFDNLQETMLKADGLGLAAPQVDQLIRIIAVNMDESTQIMINPKITKKSWSRNIAEEGCLSIPNIYAKVKRSKKINVEYLDRQGQPQKLKTKNLAARIIQHEIDHLDGILFIDKMVH